MNRERDSRGPIGQDAVLDALIRAAVDATGASRGWVVRRDGDLLTVIAAAGEQPGRALGTTVSAGVGGAGYVIESGQPLALAAVGGDARAGEGIGAELGLRPQTLLSVPASTQVATIGALELIDKQGGGGFTIDDVELAGLLGTIAATAIAAAEMRPSSPSPAALADQLEELARVEPGRYAAVAEMIAAILSRG